MKPYIIGIAGGSGSGKSTFATRLKNAFPNHVSVISCDNYYLPHDELPLQERALLNYDAPESLEFSLMVTISLCAGLPNFCLHLSHLNECRAFRLPV